MSGWNTKKRFWETAQVTSLDQGFAVMLDGRSLRTPAKTQVILPTKAMAEAVAQEWQAQGEEIDPLTMPITRCANSALDKVATQHAEVADMLADYAGTDLLCYRAEGPEALIDWQSREWDPLLDWAAETYGARLVPVSGVMFSAQDTTALSILSAKVHAMTNFQLAAFHDLVAISGSLIVGFATVEGYATAGALWNLSRLDERWQEEQWGEDEEAQEQAQFKREAFLNAAKFYKLCA